MEWRNSMLTVMPSVSKIYTAQQSSKERKTYKIGEGVEDMLTTHVPSSSSKDSNVCGMLSSACATTKSKGSASWRHNVRFHSTLWYRLAVRALLIVRYDVFREICRNVVLKSDVLIMFVLGGGEIRSVGCGLCGIRQLASLMLVFRGQDMGVFNDDESRCTASSTWVFAGGTHRGEILTV